MHSDNEQQTTNNDKVKPSIPKGTRDFSPAEMAKRNYIFDTIKEVYQRYGYLPIETPAMEKVETLTGKYGEEGDRLIFKVLARGEKLKKAMDSGSDQLAEEALRYDLTVPFARYVVQHQNDITFPFKRYQIQPVWRADRPQKGRYREFYQCDADVIGSDSLLNEVELVQIMQEVFEQLNIKTAIKINNRKILSGIAEVIGEADKIIDITVAIDKLDKIGLDKVNEELKEKGVSAEAIEKLQPIIAMSGSNEEKLATLKEVLKDSEVGMKGIEEVEYIFSNNGQRTTNNVELDITLARGLNYYTGAIFEVKADEGSLASSICGGGRYDDLTGIFGLPNVSGVGISFGADRIYDVLEELDRFPKSAQQSTKALFVNFGGAAAEKAFSLANSLRAKGVNTEMYPDEAKMKKQMAYADKKQIPFVVVIGEEEVEKGEFVLKNMESGEQETLNEEALLNALS